MKRKFLDFHHQLSMKSAVLLVVMLLKGIDSYSISSVSDLNKVFMKKAWFSSPVESYALESISASFNEQINTFIGSSGSGKSTLAKCLVGMQPISSGKIVFHPSSAKVVFAYLDPLFYLSYDEDKLVREILAIELASFQQRYPSADLAQTILSLLEQPQSNLLDMKPRAMLTTQRKSFEIILSLLRCQQCSSHPQASSTFSEQSLRAILVLDEYLDKEMTSVHVKIKAFLQSLLTSIDLQVFIVTHAKAVWQTYSDHTIVLHHGRVYDQGTIDRVQLPSSFQFIQ
jgi:peptide/nickel transport system ATP-binding protein